MFEEYDDILSVEQAAEALKVSVQAIYQLCRSGTIKNFKNGKIWRIPKSALSEYVIRQSKLQ